MEVRRRTGCSLCFTVVAPIKTGKRNKVIFPPSHFLWLLNCCIITKLFLKRLDCPALLGQSKPRYTSLKHKKRVMFSWAVKFSSFEHCTDYFSAFRVATFLLLLARVRVMKTRRMMQRVVMMMTMMMMMMINLKIKKTLRWVADALVYCFISTF